MSSLTDLLTRRQFELANARRYGAAPAVIADLAGKVTSLTRQINTPRPDPAPVVRVPSSSPPSGGTAPPVGGLPAPPTPSALDTALEQFMAYLQPRSPEAIDTLTQQRVYLAITPQRLAIERAQQQADLAARGAQSSIQGFTEAMTPALQAIGPAIQRGYTEAATTQGGLSAGFSAGLRAALNASTEASNQALQNIGSPQQLDSQAQNAGDVLYGLTGYGPASVLNREGAAFGAAAAQLPATRIGISQEQVGKIGHENVVQQAEFSRDLNELMQSVPSLQADIRGLLESENFQRAQAGIETLFDQRNFDEQVRQFEINAAAASTQAERDWWLERKDLALRTRAANANIKALGLEQARDTWDNAVTLAEATGVFKDPTTGKVYQLPQEAADAPRINLSISREVGAWVDSSGTPIPGWQNIPPPKKTASSTTTRAKNRDSAYQGALGIARNLARQGVANQRAYIQVYDYLLNSLGGIESDSRIVALWRRALIAAGYTKARNAPKPTSRPSEDDEDITKPPKS